MAGGGGFSPSPPANFLCVKMSDKVYSRSIVRKGKPKSAPEVDQDKPPKKRRVVELSIADRIAVDRFYFLNQYYPGGKEAFPGNNRMQVTTKYYPYAQGGKLYVDEPVTDFLIVECRRKIPVMRKNGVRYVLIEPDMTLEQALVQMGEQCPGQQASQIYAP